MLDRAVRRAGMGVVVGAMGEGTERIRFLGSKINFSLGELADWRMSSKSSM